MNYWIVEYELWPTVDADGVELGRHTDKDVQKGSSKIEAINGTLYDVRGRKSMYELAHIIGVDGPIESEDKARRKRWS